MKSKGFCSQALLRNDIKQLLEVQITYESSWFVGWSVGKECIPPRSAIIPKKCRSYTSNSPIGAFVNNYAFIQ